VPTGDADWTIDEALKLDQKAVIISDSGDNPTAGGAGDVSWTLGQLLARPEFVDGSVNVVHASIFDAAAALWPRGLAASDP
jgi:microcystin degradation protein MlrC